MMQNSLSPARQPFILLNGHLGWQGARRFDPQREIPFPGLAVGVNLRLSADPNGLLSLTSPHGTLGQLTLPRTLAIDEDGSVYALRRMITWDNTPQGANRARRRVVNEILRYDDEQQRFVPLSSLGGTVNKDILHPPEGRRFLKPQHICICGKTLYIVDVGWRRVSVFDLRTLALLYIWGPWDADYKPTRLGSLTTWRPVDIATMGNAVYLLDRRYGRVYRHQPGSDKLRCIIDERKKRAGQWQRVIVDRYERVYLLEGESQQLEVFTQGAKGNWEYLTAVSDPGEIREYFPPPPIVLDDKARFTIPNTTVAFQLESLRHIFPQPDEPRGKPLYGKRTVWTSTALDGKDQRCQWHRIELDMTALPAGTKVRIWTYTERDLRSDEEIVFHVREPEFAPPQVQTMGWSQEFLATPTSADNERGLWQLSGTLERPSDGTASMPVPEFLVQSREGQYLWVRLELLGDGYNSPEINALRIYYPRDSYLKYLPAVFSEDEESRWFLERFLSAFQIAWEALEAEIQGSARYFDPRTVPPGPAMDFLARWLDVEFESDWDADQRRRLLMAAPGFIRKRGTLEGLRSLIQVYLHNASGIAPQRPNCPDDNEEQRCAKRVRAFPQIVEGYRRRNWLQQADEAEDKKRLEYHRFKLGESQLDEDNLVSLGVPGQDQWSILAHRFEVYVPANMIRSAHAEQTLRAMLEREKPANTAFDLHLISSRYVLEVQATLGIDTILGVWPTAQLDSSTATGGTGQYLGTDTTVGQNPADKMPHAGHRVGIDSRLW